MAVEISINDEIEARTAWLAPEDSAGGSISLAFRPKSGQGVGFLVCMTPESAVQLVGAILCSANGALQEKLKQILKPKENPRGI